MAGSCRFTQFPPSPLECSERENGSSLQSDEPCIGASQIPGLGTEYEVPTTSVVFHPLGTGDGGSAFTRSLKIWKFRESTVSERRIAGS